MEDSKPVAIPSNDKEFYLHVVTSLTRLETGQEGMNKRLDKVNGSISTLYERTNDQAIQLTKHDNQIEVHVLNCPTRKLVDEFERKILTGDFPPPTSLSEQVKKLEELCTKLNTDREREQKKVNKWIDGLLIPIVKWVSIGTVSALIYLFLIHAKEFHK